MALRLAGALVVALAALGASVKVIPTECSKHDLPNHTVHLAHESDCTKFYKCNRGKKIVIDCPVYNEQGDRLYFNATLQFCDLPENVDCKLPRPISAIPSRVSVPTECPKSNLPDHRAVHLAHEDDCTKFYECNWGEKVLFTCPIYNTKNDRLYFNPNIQVCDWPENVDCGMPDGCIGSCPYETDIYPDRLPHKDCRKFCLCSDYGAEVHDCPPDRPHWDNDNKRCATAEETPCSNEHDDVLMKILRFRDRFIS